MADNYQKADDLSRQSHQVSGMTVLTASLAAIAIAGPLMVMMGFSFLASSTLLLVCSPLLLPFSPLLLGVAFLFVGTLAGFAFVAALALTALSILGWIARETSMRFAGLSKLGDSNHRMKGKGRDYWVDNFATTDAL